MQELVLYHLNGKCSKAFVQGLDCRVPASTLNLWIEVYFTEGKERCRHG